MKRLLVALVAISAMVALSAGCSSDDSSGGTADDSSSSGADASSGGNSSGDNSSGAVVDPAPPGQATASVDGLDYTFDLPGGLTCSISDKSITFSYRVGDNEVVLGGGLNASDGAWLGSIDLTVANPTGEAGPVSYSPSPNDNGTIDGSLVAVDGDSMSYSGPMLKQPANDGSNPPPVEVGDGTFSATCG